MSTQTASAPASKAARARHLASRCERAREAFDRFQVRHERACGLAESTLPREEAYRVSRRWDLLFGRYLDRLLNAEQALARHVIQATGAPVPGPGDAPRMFPSPAIRVDGILWALVFSDECQPFRVRPVRIDLAGAVES